MERPLISVIIPVYNVAPYLKRCLDSVAAQTWENLEVWLVDDGSTDGSLALCEARAEQDSRFRVLRQANAGVSAARNRGMDHAAGQYLQFVDGDDFLPPDATENLARTAAATGADLVVGRFWRVAGGRAAVRGHIREARVLTRQDYAEEMLKAPANSTTACCGTSSTAALLWRPGTCAATPASAGARTSCSTWSTCAGPASSPPAPGRCTAT